MSADAMSHPVPSQPLFAPAALDAWRAASAGLTDWLRSGADLDALPATYLERWAAELGAADRAVIDRRLAWSRSETGAAAAPEAWTAHLALCRAWPSASPWAEVVTAAVDASSAPFAAAWPPVLAAALDELAPGPGLVPGRLDPALLAKMMGELLAELARLGAPVLAEAFAAHLSAADALPDSSVSHQHHAFVTRLAAGGWTDVFSSHPVLARLVGVISRGWALDTRAFLDRFQNDQDALRATFFPGDSAPLAIVDVKSGLSDRHGGAAVVRVVEFAGGRRVVHKRRPLALEADFHALLRTLAEAGLGCAPPSLPVLDRGDHGWVGFAQAGPVADEAALTAWFEKAGSLLCLVHLLGGNDGHMENVVATAAGPVLIDVETLLQPSLSKADQATGTFALAARQVQDSVLQTGLLPLWQRGKNGALHDIGGLTGAGGYESPVLRQTWEDVGTDGVRATWRRGLARGLDNLPVCAGVRHSAEAHLPALQRGFAATWEFLRARPDLLPQALESWAEAPLRVLLRPTTHYAAMLARSVAPDALRDGMERSVALEALRRPFLRNHESAPALWPAVDEETAALEAGDIPIFFVRAAGRDLLRADGTCVAPGAFGETALEATLRRLGRLDEAELRRQLELIASSFIAPRSGTGTAPPVEKTGAAVDYDALLAATPLISDEGLVKTAAILGQQLLNGSIRGRDGFVTWLAPAFLQPDQREQRGVSYYLYDGAAGIALFLGALWKVTGAEAARTTALAALEPVRAILDSPKVADLVRQEGIGGCSGLGSLVYALTSLAGTFDMPELLARAEAVAALIDDSRIARDQALDLVGGSAGAIFGLLALHRATASSSVLDRAIACGRHLLDRAEKVGDDALAWPSWPDRLLLAGWSHGTAGISAALADLATASGRDEFLQAALAGLRHERTLFDATAKNWPMLEPAGGSRFVSTWCHGAPGILLSRLRLLGKAGAGEDEVLRGEIRDAAATTLAPGLSAVDHLCCGTLGRVEILHLAAAELGPRAAQLARLGATLTIRRAQQAKAFALQADPVRNAVFQPGFFRGISGLGHTFLRLARPDLVPSVLAWETSATPASPAQS